MPPDTGVAVLPWVYPDWWTLPGGGGIPRRSCDLSQQADRVGLIRRMGGRSCNEPVLPAAKSSRRKRRSQDLLSRDRNAGAHQHSDELVSFAYPEPGEGFVQNNTVHQNGLHGICT